MSDLLSQVDKTRLPRHIAIIMDGMDVGQKNRDKTGFSVTFMEWKV
jgi:undecaprenyl pyrophosphate synthase